MNINTNNERQQSTPPIPNISFTPNVNGTILAVNYDGNNLVFREILTKLSDGNPGSCQSVFALANSLEKQSIAVDDFQSFLTAAHDLLVIFDSAKRSSLLRSIRYCISSPQHVDILKEECIHYLVVNSFEKESDYSMERIQALKIMDRVRRICVAADAYPIAFARSLVSIANSKEDNFRKIALESLRELSLSHPSLVAAVQGFSTLVDAIMDPVSQEIADSVTHTILFLLNEPSTRKIVAPCVDMKSILVSFTDLDSDVTELEPKWLAAKSAFNIMMRSWVGIHLLVSDSSALPMLMNMLKDTKIPLHTQNAILDSIIEVLEPHFSRKKVTGRPKLQFSSIDESRDSPIPSSSNSLKLAYGDSRSRHVRASSDSEMVVTHATNGALPSSTSSSALSQLNLDPSPTAQPSSRPSLSQNSRQSISAVPPAPSVPANKHFSISSLFSSRGSRNSIVKASSATPPIISSTPSQQEFTSLTSEQRDILRRASTTGRPQSTLITSNTLKPEIPLGNDVEDDFSDPIYNLMDNYTALLCCAFLHVDLISSLFVLGVEGKMVIAKKSRELLVKFTKMLTNVLPESLCADLLTNPSLIDFASTLDPQVLSKAHKSSQILLEMVSAFSIMPFQQTSGSHISNLSVFGGNIPNGVVSTRNRTGSTSKSSAGMSIHNSSNKDAGAASSHPYNGAVVGTSPGNLHHSNFQSLNIQTLFELAEEIKISSFSTISSLPKLTADHTSAIADVLENLRVALSPAVDKVDFIRQMDMSRVIGKEGKEPFKWDWVTISDMLEYSFFHQDRLAEALKTKWVRRISGFYRCSVEEKGYFANLEWDPTNLQYLECACHLYSVLLHDENGMAFLTSDRRGMLFNEIARELEQLTISASSSVALGSSSVAINSNQSAGNGSALAGGGKNVFRLTSCNSLMAREYFTLLGRIVRTPNSRKLLDHTNIFKYLSQLGQYPSLDYMCRLVITSLSFTDGGMMSKHLLQLWTTQANCTTDNKNYYHTLLRVLLHTFAAEVEHQQQQQSLVRIQSGNKPSLTTNANYQWCLEAIVSQLSVDDSPSDMIIKSLNEAIQNRNSLRMIVSKRPKIIDEPVAQDILVRFLAIPEGIDYLNEKGWMDRAFTDWHEHKCAQYVLDIEERISLALMASLAARKGTQSVKGVLYTPSSKVSTGTTENKENLSQLSMISMIIKVVDPIPVKIPDGSNEWNPGSSVCSHQANNRFMDANDALVVDLHGFLRIPWNMELKISNQANASIGDNTPGEFIKMDAFLDASDMSSPLSFEISSDSNRILKVRGLVLDTRGLPNGKLISPNMTLFITLMAGVCPIFKSGRVQPFSDLRGNSSSRRRASTSATTNAAATSGVSSTTGTGRGSVSATSGSPHTIPTVEDASSDQDMPNSFGQESLYEWFLCKPSQRQGQLIQEGDTNRYFLALPGEPVVFVFERRQVQPTPNQRPSRSGSISKMGAENMNWTESGRVNSYNFGSSAANPRIASALYLVEVQYYLRFETGMSVFVPMPRHIYGELSRTLDGCTHLARRSIVADSVSRVRTLYDSIFKSTASTAQVNSSESVATGDNVLTIRSLLWSLGNIGSCDHGFNAIDTVDPTFMDWCVDGACSCPHFTIRATYFYVLGLFSRSNAGCRKISKRGWDFASHGSNSAVAFPRSPALLFRKIVEKSNTKKEKPQGNQTGVLPYSNPMFMNAPSSIFVLTPFINSDGISKEQEVLNIICKMPGVILYRDCKVRLENIKKDYPQVFSNRQLYVEVLKILESYTFKLTARRDIINLFSDEAKKKRQYKVEPIPLSSPSQSVK